ncbi:MAG: hypothetical protein ABF665_13795, partial [Gluconacetobacter sp.]
QKPPIMSRLAAFMPKQSGARLGMVSKTTIPAYHYIHCSVLNISFVSLFGIIILLSVPFPSFSRTNCFYG